MTNIAVTIFPAPLCGAPGALSANAIDTSADFSWNAPGSGSPIGYDWEIQPDGVAQGTAGAIASGTTAATSVNSGVVLTASTSYEFYVRTDCDGDGQSDYATVGFITTSGPPPPNDDFSDAIPVACAGNYTGNTSTATLDEDDAPDNPAADLDAPNVWYSYTGSGTAEGIISDLCPSQYDSSVLVYTGSSGNLTLVAANDDGGTDNCGNW